SVLACNNRCPHEGYPLCEGTLDSAGLLTCQWHNWKFDLRTGANRYGGDALRVYPVRIEQGRVWLDLSDPPPAQRVAQALGRLGEAVDDHDPARIARELARLEHSGATPEAALLQALKRSHTRLRYGMTHAYAAADAWLHLRDMQSDPGQRLACATEALAYIGFDTLREAEYPYTSAQRSWSRADFLAAVEAQDEAAALACVNEALARAASLDSLLPTLAEAALAHYNDFGHSLIYLTHVRSLVDRLGAPAASPLLRAWVRSLVHATREDLLPDFKHFRDALAQWPVAPQADEGLAPPTAAMFESLPIRQTLAATRDAAARHPPQHLWQALMQAGAQHLLRFDERHALRTDNPVGVDVGWLDFSHALTFGHALRQLASIGPDLWPAGLLQMALFVGRNTAYLVEGLDSAAAVAAWRVDDPAAFEADAQLRIIDHGIGVPIFAAHRLKTWLAVHDTVVRGVAPAGATALCAAVNRLLAVQFKQRHALRVAQQALRFVERE
ncbi:MAG: Rieske (2Fe-2S) protein, partial [Rubrivivax sp.]